MNNRIVWNYLGRIMALESICMLPALFIAVFKHEKSSFFAFLITMLLQLCIGLGLNLVKVKVKKMYAREGIVIVAMSWIVISLFGALPMFFSEAIPSYLDAVFETVSGFTTTGGTILTDVEALPMSILYWRSFTHWLGGMGVLVFILALAPTQQGNGMSLHIMRAESPGPDVGKLAPKTHSTARILYIMYFILTLTELFLLLCGRMPFFDALTATFGTAGTGGFAVKNSSIAVYSTYCQAVISIFMLLFGVNFSIYFLILMGEWKSVWKNSELRTYLGIIFASTIAVTIAVRGYFSGLFQAFHHAFFQVVSIITTTGFSTVDFNLWPEFTHSLLLILMVIGACAGSTGGGFKISRVILLFKTMKVEIKKCISPRSVSVITLGGKPVERTTMDRCAAFLSIYVVSIAISTLLVSIDGFGFKTSFSGVLACINNIGPGFEEAGPVGSFAAFSPFTKIVLIFDMLLGRLELYPLLLIFMPSTWRTRGY